MGIAGIIAAIVAAAGSLLGSLKGSGVNIGNIGDLALQDIQVSQVDEQNYLNGQAVAVAPFSYQGEAGTVVIVKNGGVAAQAIGL